MPPKKPAPIMFFHFKSLGKVQIPNPMPIKENSQIPSGFPRINPNKIPKLFGWSKLSPMLPWNAILVLASANKGKIKERRKRYDEINKEKKKEYMREWRKKRASLS